MNLKEKAEEFYKVNGHNKEEVIMHVFFAFAWDQLKQCIHATLEHKRNMFEIASKIQKQDSMLAYSEYIQALKQVEDFMKMLEAGLKDGEEDVSGR